MWNRYHSIRLFSCTAKYLVVSRTSGPMLVKDQMVLFQFSWQTWHVIYYLWWCWVFHNHLRKQNQEMRKEGNWWLCSTGHHRGCKLICCWICLLSVKFRGIGKWSTCSWERPLFPTDHRLYYFFFLQTVKLLLWLNYKLRKRMTFRSELRGLVYLHKSLVEIVISDRFSIW